MQHKDDVDMMSNRILAVEPVVFVGMNSVLPKKDKLRILKQRLRELEKQNHG